MEVLVFLLFILVLSIFLGFEIISKVPSLLHTPLMSGSNAISGITVVGAMIAAGLGEGNDLAAMLGGAAVGFAAAACATLLRAAAQPAQTGHLGGALSISLGAMPPATRIVVGS